MILTSALTALKSKKHAVWRQHRSTLVLLLFISCYSSVLLSLNSVPSNLSHSKSYVQQVRYLLSIASMKSPHKKAGIPLQALYMSTIHLDLAHLCPWVRLSVVTPSASLLSPQTTNVIIQALDVSGSEPQKPHRHMVTIQAGRNPTADCHWYGTKCFNSGYFPMN